MKLRLSLLFAILLLSGCASSPVPEMIGLDGAEGLSVAQAQADPQAARGRAVRWGGEILSVTNRPKDTDIVVLRHDLFSGGEPKPEGGEDKRFLARIPGFLDPAQYRPGQRLTVAGRLDGIRTLKVGEYDYPHPVVDVQQYYRWGKYQPPQVPPWHTDPFYCDPFVPWGYPNRGFCW